MLKKITIILLVLVIYGQKPRLLNISPDIARYGSSVALYCNATITAAISFKLNGTSAGSCGPPSLGKPGICTPKDILQNLSESSTIWTKTAVNVSDNGLWTCELAGIPSRAERLLIYEFPQNTLAEIGITSNITVFETSSYPVHIGIACLFSETAPSFHLQFVAGGAVYRSVPMACVKVSTTCSPCIGCSAYDCNHTLSLEQAPPSDHTEYLLQIEVGVTGNSSKFTQQVFAPFTVKFENASRRSESLKNFSAGELAGIAIGTVALVGIIGVVTLLAVKHMKGKGNKDVES